MSQAINDLLKTATWHSLEEHLDGLRESVDRSIAKTHGLRKRYRDELLANPQIAGSIRQPKAEALQKAQSLLGSGVVAAADGTVAPVPLLGGAKIQVGVVIVSNRGDLVELVTRVFEAELVDDAGSASDYFQGLRDARKFSNILSRAIMLLGERRHLLDQEADWRMVHGELFPYELRTGAGNPRDNLPPSFQMVRDYVESETFIAVTESADNDLDLLNAATVLDPGEYIDLWPLERDLTQYLYGNEERGVSRANFTKRDLGRYENFVQQVGQKVRVVMVKAGSRPFLIQCHVDRVEEAVALFMADSLWTRGLDSMGSTTAYRGFPFHIDLADQVARNMLKAGDFRGFIEARLFERDIESALFDIDPRRTR